MAFVVLIHFLGQATAFFSSASWPCLHFNITTALYARIFDSVRSFLHFFHIYTKSTATQTYHRNFMLVVIFSGRNSKMCHGRARYSLVVESQSYFVSDRPTFFPILWATSQIPKQGTSPYSFLWERGLLAIVTPTDAHQAATKEEKWLLSYQKSHANQTAAVINSSTKQSDYRRMLFPENSSLQCFGSEQQYFPW